MKKSIAICLLLSILLVSCISGENHTETTSYSAELEITASESISLETETDEEASDGDRSEETVSEETLSEESLSDTTVQPSEEESTVVTETLPESESEELSPPPTDDAAEDDDYQRISARSVDRYAQSAFTFADSEVLMLLSFPSDWKLLKTDTDKCSILRGGVQIGTLVLGGKQGSSDWKLLDTDYSQKGTVLAEHYLEKTGMGETLQFRHRYYFRYQEGFSRRIITFTVDYAELDERSASQVMAGRNVISKRMLDGGFGTLSEAQWGSIAILGNSFISSSRIGGILYDMHAQSGKECYINAMARGYAHIDTYVNDDALMAEIAAGVYDAVFICGVNSNLHLKILKDVCDASGTALMIFPAHNESQGNIDSALDTYPDVRLMDWKGEIDALINDGRDTWDFCINDDHKHSTPLAGYVGAHMIYRAIWGEVPTGEIGYGVTQEEVDSILGDYAKTGRVVDFDPDDVVTLE